MDQRRLQVSDSLEVTSNHHEWAKNSNVWKYDLNIWPAVQIYATTTSTLMAVFQVNVG